MLSDATSLRNPSARRWPLLLAIAALGCTPDGPPASFTVTDSAGVEVITSHAPAWGDTPAWSVAREPALRIGPGMEDPRYELYRVVDVRRLRDGRILVANAGTDELRFYGPDGEWIRSAGGTGEGPGEFRQISTVAVGADSIWVWDLALARISVFDDSGEYGRGISLSQAGEGPPPGLAGGLSDGRLILREYVRFWGTNPEPGVQPIPIQYHLADREGNVLKGMGEFEHGVHLVLVREDSRSSTTVPFGRRSYFAATDDGFLFGTGQRFEVGEYDASGELQRIMRLDRVPEPIGREDIEAWIDSAAARSSNPDARRVFRERYADVSLPATKPTYMDVRVGESGDVWLKRFPLPGEGPFPWTVFDSAGVYLGTIAMPDGFELHQVGDDFVLGVTTNDLDVETVGLYSLERGPGFIRR